MTEETDLGNLRRLYEGRVSTILKASREDSDVTQERLANLVGWTRNTIANLESGRRAVSLSDFLCLRHIMTPRSQYAEKTQATCQGDHHP